MNKLITLTALSLALAAPLAAQAQTAGSLLVRARAVHLDSANSDSTGLGLTINNKWLPEVDFTYFLSPNLAAELILTYPQKQNVYSDGAKIGTFKHLPPTLTLQYHLTGIPGFKPYVGAGLNYTRLSGIDILDGGATLKKNSYGLAAQIGADIPLGGSGLMLNIDLKKVQIGTKVYVNGEGGRTDMGKFKVDPLLVGVGLGMKF